MFFTVSITIGSSILRKNHAGNVLIKEMAMSEFRIEIVRLGPVEALPNSNFLSITRVHGGYPCVIKSTDFKEGDLAVYVPVDGLVPLDHPKFAFLKKEGDMKTHHRLRAVRLRGTFSMGLLVPADSDMKEGEDVRERLGIIKYEPPEPFQMGGDNEKDPGFLPTYTDIEGLRRWPDVLVPGEEVVISEKVHGANARFAFHEGRLWAGSHTGIKKRDPNNLWWKAAIQYGLEEKLQRHPGIVFYGEVFGRVQDLHYGTMASGQIRLAFFDALDVTTRTYLPWDRFQAMLFDLELPLVPILYRGPWKPELVAHAEGESTVPDAKNVREGMVVKPVQERWHDKAGRAILKVHGEGYLTRKGG